MEWYGWVLLALVAVSIIAIVIILIYKSQPIIRGLSEEERDALIDLEKVRINKNLEIEKEKVQKLQDLATDLKDHLKMLQVWYEDAKDKIDAARQSEFENYLGDPDAAGDKLDELLGSSDNIIVESDKLGREDPTA